MIWKAACFISHSDARSEIAPGLGTISIAQKPSELRNLYGRPARAFSKHTGLCLKPHEPSINCPCCRGPRLTALSRSGIISRASIQLPDFTSRPYLFPSHIAGDVAVEILCNGLVGSIARGKMLGAKRAGATPYVEVVEGSEELISAIGDGLWGVIDELRASTTETYRSDLRKWRSMVMQLPSTLNR